MKAKKTSLDRGREGGRKDQIVPPSGVPVDLLNKSETQPLKRGKEVTKLALTISQTSTASLGKFDKVRDGEPERRLAMSKMKKQKFESTTDKNVIQTEKIRQTKILNNVISGGGKEKEKAIRRGEYSTGETAYDYDFVSAGASTFKKKKGRAGVGKLKKVTKKRAR